MNTPIPTDRMVPATTMTGDSRQPGSTRTVAPTSMNGAVTAIANCEQQHLDIDDVAGGAVSRLGMPNREASASESRDRSRTDIRRSHHRADVGGKVRPQRGDYEVDHRDDQHVAADAVDLAGITGHDQKWSTMRALSAGCASAVERGSELAQREHGDEPPPRNERPVKSVDSGRRGVDAVPSGEECAVARPESVIAPEQYEAPNNERAVPVCLYGTAQQGRAVWGSGAGAAAAAAAGIAGVGAAESGEDTVADQLDDVPDGGVGSGCRHGGSP